MNNNKTDLCRSVFKSGENTSGEEFTRVWIELINKLEKNKLAKPIKK